MSPFYVFRKGPKEVDGVMQVYTRADGNNDICAELKPLKDEKIKVTMKSFNAFGLTGKGADFSDAILKAESFLIYDGFEPTCQEIVIYSKKGLKTRDEWWK